jgi:hypothetical protein
MGAGGICGAEGAVRLLVEGTPVQVQAALALFAAIQGETAFI